MTELIEERFEQILTETLALVATKEDVNEGVDQFARIIVSDGFDDMRERLDVAEQIGATSVWYCIRISQGSRQDCLRHCGVIKTRPHQY